MLKLTTDKLEALRRLSATAELLVSIPDIGRGPQKTKCASRVPDHTPFNLLMFRFAGSLSAAYGT